MRSDHAPSTIQREEEKRREEKIKREKRIAQGKRQREQITDVTRILFTRRDYCYIYMLPSKALNIIIARF